jgi:hypothetical protein
MAGRRLAAVGGAPLRRLLELIGKAEASVEPCCSAGWLGLMIAEEKVEDFAAIHNAMLQVLKVRVTCCLCVDQWLTVRSLLHHCAKIEL